MATKSSKSSVKSKANQAGRPLALVLITPARNEAAFIEQTIQAVVTQTVQPVRWIIVSDGSTDGTDEIVRRYAAMYPWIELLRMPERRDRHFAAKVTAFNAAYARLEGVNFDVIGNLDADITFEEDYLEFLLAKFAANPRLGVAGTPFHEESKGYDYRFTSVEHVSGACQLFRKQCFEAIGGYIPIRLGGIDLVAVITARMKGWQTRAFLEKASIHHRKIGRAKRNAVVAAWRGGEGDYLLGGHPFWEFVRCIYQMKRPPYVAGGALRFAGFAWAMIRQAKKVVSPEFVTFRRKEQMTRLRAFVARCVRGRINTIPGTVEIPEAQ